MTRITYRICANASHKCICYARGLHFGLNFHLHPSVLCVIIRAANALVGLRNYTRARLQGPLLLTDPISNQNPALWYILGKNFDWIIKLVSYAHASWKRCFLKTSVSNGIIYTKYTQNPHSIEPPFNIATQSAYYTVTACVSRWEPNGLNANNPCPAARQNNIGILLVCCGFQL